MNFTKEVEYVFNYEIDGQVLTVKELHFVDDVDNRRYRWINPGGEGYPQPLNFAGTRDTFKQIEPTLIGDALVQQNPQEEIRVVMFDLLDVDAVMITNVIKMIREGNAFYDFIVNNVTNYHKKIMI